MNRLALLLLFLAVLSGQALALRDAQLGERDLEQRWRKFMQDASRARPAGTFPYAHCFRKSAADHDLPESLLLAVARGESDFDPRARSSANAYGLMQILWPQTAQHLGIQNLADLTDPCTNVDAGARYLKEMLERYQGNLHRALAAYNYGPGRIPAQGGRVPEGAVWYSGYIHRHLQHVVSAQASSSGRLSLISFQRPYRAAAFVASVQPVMQGIRLDWFRRPQGGFVVVMLYGSRDELAMGKRLLSQLGVSTGQRQGRAK